MKMRRRKTLLLKQCPAIQMVNVLVPVLAITGQCGAGVKEVLAMRKHQLTPHYYSLPYQWQLTTPTVLDLSGPSSAPAKIRWEGGQDSRPTTRRPFDISSIVGGTQTWQNKSAQNNIRKIFCKEDWLWPVYPSRNCSGKTEGSKSWCQGFKPD